MLGLEATGGIGVLTNAQCWCCSASIGRAREQPVRRFDYTKRFTANPEGDVHQSTEWTNREGGYLLKSTTQIVVLLTVVTGLLMSCSTAPSTSGGRDELLQQATASMSEMSREDPGLDELARRAYGYALFPEVAKGGLVFGGAYGRGVVYEQGQHIGYADLSQASFGLQLGGQTYTELIVFENKASLERLTQGRLDLVAEASAVILKTGAAANARFVDGVAIFVRPIGGAMAEASVGGQQVTYVPK